MKRHLVVGLAAAAAASMVSACNSGAEEDEEATKSSAPLMHDANIPWMESDLARQVDARFHVHGTVVRCPMRHVRWSVGQEIRCPITVPGAAKGYALYTLVNDSGRWSWVIANHGDYARN